MREQRSILDSSAVHAWVLNFLEPMLIEPGLGISPTGVIVSRQMNPKSC